MKENILLVCDGLQPGGAERQTLLLARELCKYWNPILVSLGDGQLSTEYKKYGIPFHVIERKFRYDIASPIIRLDKIIRKYNPVLLHNTWGYMAAIIASIALLGRDIPFITGVIRNGTIIPNKNNIIIKYASRLGDKCIANSHAGLTAWKIPKSKGEVIYNGFDSTRLSSKDSIFKKNPNAYRIIMTASMTRKKDWSAYIQVARRISANKECNNVEFYGFGDGTCRERILNEASDLLEQNLVVLPGRIEDTIPECKNSNIGVLLSPYGEGMSNSIMEYMACGLPVICTNSGGNPELVIDGITGFLVCKDNPCVEVVEKIIWLNKNPMKAKKMGEAGKNRINNYFSNDNMLQQYVNMYKSIIGCS